MVKNSFSNTIQALNGKDSCDDLFVLFGVLSNAIIFSSISIIEEKLIKLSYPKKTVTRAKLVGLELLDNMLKHQAKEASLNPFFQLIVSNGELTFVTGNSISSVNYKYLKDKLKAYQNLSFEDVNDLYMTFLDRNELDQEGNAGLGLLTVMKRTKNHYKYAIEKVTEEEYYFNSAIKLN